MEVLIHTCCVGHSHSRERILSLAGQVVAYLVAFQAKATQPRDLRSMHNAVQGTENYCFLTSNGCCDAPKVTPSEKNII